MQILMRFLNFLISGAGEVISVLLLLFPSSPFSQPASPPKSVDLGYVTWLIPFPQMIQHFALLLSAIGAYYIVRVVARWVKLVRS